jgi:hypothetical protein
MEGELELTLFMDRPTPAETRAIRKGRSEFALYDCDDLVVLSYRFIGALTTIPWSDAPYQWHLVPPVKWTDPPAPETLTAESRVPLFVVLVNAIGGLIEAQKVVTLSPEFTRRLFAAIRTQASRPYDPAVYDRSLKSLYSKYTSYQLVEASAVRCNGGT